MNLPPDSRPADYNFQIYILLRRVLLFFVAIHLLVILPAIGLAVWTFWPAVQLRYYEASGAMEKDLNKFKDGLEKDKDRLRGYK